MDDKVPCACRIESHIHKTGEIHLTIELMVPPGCSGFARRVESEFNALLEKLSGNSPYHSESYVGEEAIRKGTTSIEDYYKETAVGPLYDPQKMN